MSTVEAAASLFGGSDGDSGPDPFAVIGNEVGDTSTQPPAHNEQAQQSISSYPLEMGQDTSSLFTDQMYPGAQASQDDPWSIPTTQTSHSQQTNGSASSHDHQHVHSAEVSHSTAYEAYSTYTSQPVMRSGYAETPTDYDPYKPASSPSYQAEDGYSKQQYTSAHSDPYNPTTTTTVANTFSTQPPASQQQAFYDQYRPASRSVSSPYSFSTSASVSSPPPASSYRPKTSNAYDPPLPPPKASKRAVSARAPHPISPPGPQYAYPAYVQQTLPPSVAPVPALPPPPAGSPRYGSLTPTSVPPPRPPSGPSPQRQATQQSDANPYNALPHTPASLHERYLCSPQHEASGSQPSYSTTDNLAPLQPSYISQGTPTLPQTSNHISNIGAPETHSRRGYDSPIQQEPPDTRTFYTSDDMPWDDPEGGLGDQSHSTFFPSGGMEDLYPPYSAASTSGSSPHRAHSQALPQTAAPSEPIPPPAPVGMQASAPPNSPSTSLSRMHHRQDTAVPTHTASPKPSSSHSQSTSNGPVGSSLRSPVKRMSSPLRYTVDSNERDADSTVISARVSNIYDSSPYAHRRTSSPTSVHSLGSQQGGPLAAPYDPVAASAFKRTTSPSSLRSQSPALNSYTPPKTMTAFATSQLHGRSDSNESTLSAPVEAGQQWNEYGLGLRSHYGPAGVPAYSMGQEVYLASATRPPYAPSPSLLGSNDPLGRTSARAPIMSFGFGGKMLTCFHDSADLNTGFDVALSSRRTTNVTVRVLHKALPEYALEAKAAEYPGPLLADPGSPATGLMRTGASTKTKKTRVIKYLDERTEEISRGIAYMSDSVERQHVEGKLVLVRLLKIMVENDGALSGSPQIDAAVRAAILPRIANTVDKGNQDGSASFPTPGFASSVSNAYAAPTNSETPISVTTLLPSSLDRIQGFLVRGERRRAYHYALDERLWAHAMIIASGIDKEAWKEVVNEFLRTELGVHDRNALSNRSKDAPPQQTSGREWLRVAYSLFSGQGPSAVQQLVPINLLSKATTGVPTPIPTVTPNFPSVAAAQIPTELLSKWPEIVASIVTSPMTPEWSATLTALGDCLASHSLVEGAHVCYLLSLQTSIIGGIGSPGVRMVLLGSQSSFFRDSDPVLFSEIAEFALSLKAVPKGQEPFHGFPHLQAFKFIRATYLAEIGQVQAATRYCEAITILMNRPSPYFNSTLIEQLKSLTDRLIGTPHSDKPASWIGGKVNKPSLDSIGSWLEGRLTKFIAGEGDEPSATDASRAQRSAFTGPFSSYSSITPMTTSASSSPAPTMINSYSMSATQLPRRSGSAMALPSAQTHIPVDRASSAMECYRPTHNVSPAPPKTAPLHSTGMYSYSPHSIQTNGPTVSNGFSSVYASEPSSRKPSLEITAEEGPSPDDQQQLPQETAGWWNTLSSTDSVPTPTFATFHPVDVGATQDGFISLMNDSAMPIASNTSDAALHKVESVEDDEDDLGLGNNAHGKKDDTKVNGDSKPAEASVEPTDKAEQKHDPQPPPAQTVGAFGSWLSLSRIWKRSDTPGPVKASLGEETSFYYDKELKRWVNKKATAPEAQPTAPPAPPSRAQTASPSRANGRQPGTPNGHASAPPLAPPVARTASAIDLHTSATNTAPVRMRSNLVPTEVTSMPSTPAPGATGMPPPPPMGRPRSQAAKKNLRSRYVDVFQQEEGGA